MKNALAIHNLNFAYEDGPAILRDFSLTVPEGQWLAVVGHNGSGKSTLSKLLLGLLAAQSGEMKVFDRVLSEETLPFVRQQIGLVFQNPDNQFVGATVADDVAFGLENKQVDPGAMQATIDQVLAQVGMTDYADRQPDTLSGGQKQRVALASVLALQPKVIILDEATAMLDPAGKAAVLQLLQKLKARYQKDLTLIMVTHDMEEAALADRVVGLENGQLAFDEQPGALFQQGELLARLGLARPFTSALANALPVQPTAQMNEQELLAWLSASKR
ncbi:energy-coupling factor transporter ATPase [Leuconostocaceae bacterium ESL0958]|nr:energy-coupling factor transporter ATPase [Leuconostocaceae bacterium ESL0958]